VLPHAFRHRLPGEKVVKLGTLMERGTEAEMYRSLLSACQNPDGIMGGRGSAAVDSAVEHALARNPTMPLLSRMMAVDQATYLADDLLAKVDRASMAVSLEVRVPLLAHEVVEYTWRLPRRFKVRNNEGKWALRQVLYRHVPRELVERPKMGFTVPVAAWLRGPLRSWAGDLLFVSRSDGDGLLDEGTLRKKWRALERGQLEEANSLWAILMLQAWRERWL
jgi:asparagine synthase (glutamine-hydrolysing)